MSAGLETAFTVDASRVTFGRGCLAEVGVRARALGVRRAAVFTDGTIRALPWFDEVLASLRAAGVDAAVFDAVAIEPTDGSFEEARRFAADARPDGYVSLGGGSVIDTCKAANLYATHPAPLGTYVNAPAGEGAPVPGPLAPHVACPTTSGTGSEVTGIAIFDWAALHVKTGIASPWLRPTEAVVDPRVTRTLPAAVVAASGMDVLCHALESYTARPYVRRAAPSPATARPASQGANPWSDIGCREALALCGRYLARAVADAADDEAREQMMWAATLAGIAFGNAGVHAPHAMAYAIAGGAGHDPTTGRPTDATASIVRKASLRSAGGGVRDFRVPGYPDAPLVPHGMAVAVAAPSVFRATGAAAPERHREAARLLGGGEDLAAEVIRLMREIAIPNGTGGVGYTRADIPALVDGTLGQQRLLANAPLPMTAPVLGELFEGAVSYWS
ncbi:MAG: iron-containing alcohol dehydrogenase [Deltaproteobacteria bacterium]|nr:iron-containing alcohol dehydrogenase [Deltaproteobacteria bacterium]